MTYKILIVEDEPIVSKYIEACLKNSGFEVAGIYTSGEEAIENIDKNAPDLVLMDINLNGQMSGTDAAVVIKESHNLPIIFLTAFTDDKNIQKSLESEPYGYLVKPFYEKELRTTIEIAMHKHDKVKLLQKERDLFYTIVENKGSTDGIYVRANNRLNNIKFTDICYVEALRDYINISTTTDNYTSRINMKEITKNLPEKDFVRVHKSFIVRLDKIYTIRHISLVLEDTMKEIPVGNFYRKALLARLNII